MACDAWTGPPCRPPQPTPSGLRSHPDFRAGPAPPRTGLRLYWNPKTLADLFPKAVRDLASSAARYKPALQKGLDITTDQMQKGVILDSIDSCNDILEAVAKLPAVVDKMKKKN